MSVGLFLLPTVVGISTVAKIDIGSSDVGL